MENSFKDKKIVSFRFPEDSEIEYIGKDAFSSSTIQFIQIPKKLKRIESNCFSYCYGELETIGKSAFPNTSIEFIRIPKAVKKIEQNCFTFCKKLISTEFSEDSELEFLGDSIFSYSTLETLIIPPKVVSIDRISKEVKYLINISISPSNDVLQI